MVVKIFSTMTGFTRVGKKSAQRARVRKQMEGELGEHEMRTLRIRMEMQQLSRNAVL